MINRPFAIRCVDTAPAGTLDVVIRFSANTTPSDEGLRLVRRLMGHFIQVGANGALSGSRIPPIDSTLVLSAERIGPDRCAWRFEQVRVASDTRMVLENIVHFVHLNVSPVAQLDLIMQPGGGMMTAFHEPPKLFAPLPFQCVIEPEAAEVVIDIDFDHPVTDKNAREQFVRFWDSWVYIAAAGGFESEDFTSRGITIFPASEPDSQPDQISLFMDDVSVAATAFDALVNGFHRLHFTVAPIRRLHVY